MEGKPTRALFDLAHALRRALPSLRKETIVAPNAPWSTVRRDSRSDTTSSKMRPGRLLGNPPVILSSQDCQLQAGAPVSDRAGVRACGFAAKCPTVPSRRLHQILHQE